MAKRALFSVYDKTGVVEFARGLHELGWELLASGGTGKALGEAGLPVRPASEYEGFGGRVKTLHAPLHAAILARPQDAAELAALGAQPIDLVAVNLYPFRAQPAVETIDVGGPSLLRGAAKNHARVTAVCDPADYPAVLAEIRGSGDTAPETRRALAGKVFAHTAAYDAAIAAWFGAEPLAFPDELALGWRRGPALRYGENPHQRAAVYLDGTGGLAAAATLQGLPLSYNNLCDADAALELVFAFPGPACVAVKHGGPCGVGLGCDPAEAYARCQAADPVSIFGGVVAWNRPLDGATVAAVGRQHLDVVLAPSVTEEARAALRRKKNLRVLEVAAPGGRDYRIRRIHGGVLVQEKDFEPDTPGWRVVAGPEPDWEALRFAWTVCRFVPSNAVVVAGREQTYGIGGGQPNRVGAARIALAMAGGRARGAVAATDGFCFPDTVQVLAEAGVAALAEPGGSVQDPDVVAAAERLGITLVMTGVRHFRH
jgi:phosphoribosylaminoimidazolecarboxamide formyltransferase/IMP cyclohydrolase